MGLGRCCDELHHGTGLEIPLLLLLAITRLHRNLGQNCPPRPRNNPVVHFDTTLSQLTAQPQMANRDLQKQVVHACTSVILAGKHGSCGHSFTSFSKMS